MEDFKQYLSEGADDDEQAAAKQVLEGLSRIRLENKLAAVAVERQAWLRRRFYTRVVFTATLAIITGLACWFFRKKEMPGGPIPAPNPLLKPIQQTPVLPPDTIEQTPKGPIANRRIDPAEQVKKPLLRSAKPDLDPQTNQLIDTLLQITLKDGSAHPLKNSGKQKGLGAIVELLRKNRYQEAKTKILGSCELPSDRECNWLLGIALLEEGKPEDALPIFERIAQDPDHPRRKAAKLAADALR